MAPDVEPDAEGDAEREHAFAQLRQVNRLLAADRVDEGAAAAAALLAAFARRPDGAGLAGFGTMLLDACFWLLCAGRDRDTLTIARALVARLAGGGGGSSSEAGRAVAAGGRFFAAQSAARLGEADAARLQIAALGEMGEPAIVALDRIAGQFAATEVDPAWHAQLAAATVTVLWRLGRTEQARALAEHAARRFTQLGLTPLATTLRSLGEEIAAGG